MKEKFPFDEAETTVLVARKWLMATASKGAVCPCCSQVVKVYRRTLTSAMAYCLLVIFKAAEGGPVHVPTALNGHGSAAAGGDFAKLVYWGLLEARETAGYYRVTERGRLFVECRIAVPKAVFVYNGECISVDSKENVTIVDALGAKYSYDDLMSG